jgi:hypothetical protein
MKAPERKSYILVRDTGPFERQNDLLPILEVAEWNTEARLLRPESVVMFHGPSYYQEAIPFELVGRLTSTSTATPMARYNAEKGYIVPQPGGASDTKHEAKTRGGLRSPADGQKSFSWPRRDNRYDILSGCQVNKIVRKTQSSYTRQEENQEHECSPRDRAQLESWSLAHWIARPRIVASWSRVRQNHVHKR